MSTPSEFERLIAAEFEARGYRTTITGGPGDWGVDIVAERHGEKLAIQAKMYGGAREVNRRQVFELYGAAAYFDCTGSVLATDGRVAPDAVRAARKLGIEVFIPAPTASSAGRRRTSNPGDGNPVPLTFDGIWRDVIIPLCGQTLAREDGSTNEVVAVDWGGLTRRTSTGREQHIPIEIFRWAVERVLTSGSVTRDSINMEYEGRASSGVVLVLAQVPAFEVVQRPLTIRLRRDVTAALRQLEQLGFVGLRSVAALSESRCREVPAVPGVYVVTTEQQEPEFLQRSTGGWFKGHDPTVDVIVLRQRWLSGASVLYVGMAGTSLRERVKALVDYGCGRPVGHQGGRYLWQVANSMEFCVAWMPSNEPRETERRLLGDFRQTHGSLPFANLRD